ncbi:MAG: hypothetical protein HFI20_06155 [Lachnospiraceae bacterium]|jgi:hypothetical protein|nr:hypothetical protein [Lachnospiraceae bacterium]MCI9305534.1 hypothetical protein [Lachnospiraceae bacterium]
MEQETSGFEQDLKASRKYRWKESKEGEIEGEDRAYTQSFETVCPVDSSKVVHTVRFLKSTCTRVDDIVDDFHCNRNGNCVKCTENYR